MEQEGVEVVVRVGRYGPYVQVGDQKASLPEDLAPDELTVARAVELAAAPSGDRVLGVDPITGYDVVARAGRYGPYVSLTLPEGSKDKPPTGSLFKTMDLETITLDDALLLLTLPVLFKLLLVTALARILGATAGVSLRTGLYLAQAGEFGFVLLTLGADRGLVASVFTNRLRIGMPLQTDPTVIYGLGERFDGNLRKRDLLADTPYNTYTRGGLPPTPISLPGLASLRRPLSRASSLPRRVTPSASARFAP